MNLIIDYGNSAAKVGIFNNQNLEEKAYYDEWGKFAASFKNQSYQHAIISSVSKDAREIAGVLNVVGEVIVLDKGLPLPIKNNYATPATLGVDRIAAACGASALYPERDNLIVDAGTCITFEFVDRNGVYHGGAISPGLKMRFKAVNTFTARLPLLTPASDAKLIGDSTESCIQSGVINGTVAEIEGIIKRYATDFNDLNVILCGGDSRFFENKLKASIFAVPDLVLIGLNSILLHNVSR